MPSLLEQKPMMITVGIFSLSYLWKVVAIYISSWYTTFFFSGNRVAAYSFRREKKDI